VSEPTYHKHMVHVMPGVGSNYYLLCSCNWELRLATRSDTAAAQAALGHVKATEHPTVEELFDRL
jgi:hypothetical protein